MRLDQSNDRCHYVLCLKLQFYPLYQSSKHQKKETVQARERKQDGAEKQSERQKG